MAKMFSALYYRRQYIQDCLGKRCSKNLFRIKVITVSFLLVNYFAAFFDVYVNAHKYLPTDLMNSIPFFFVFLNNVQPEMFSHGDADLYAKYAVFTFINVLILFFTIFLSNIVFEGTKKGDYYHDIGKHFLLGLFVIVCPFSIIFIFNETGYNNSRFPIYPMLGRGEFFFVRDTLFLSGTYWIVVEMVSVGRLILTRGEALK